MKRPSPSVRICTYLCVYACMCLCVCAWLCASLRWMSELVGAKLMLKRLLHYGGEDINNRRFKAASQDDENSRKVPYVSCRYIMNLYKHWFIDVFACLCMCVFIYERRGWGWWGGHAHWWYDFVLFGFILDINRSTRERLSRKIRPTALEQAAQPARGLHVSCQL